MKITVREMQSYPVQIGELTVYLSEYQIVGGCGISEQGTADGSGTVTAAFPKGTRLTLRGKLAPSSDMAAIIAAVDAAMRGGTTLPLHIKEIRCDAVRLIGFTLKEGQEFPELTLLCYTQSALVKETAA